MKVRRRASRTLTLILMLTALAVAGPSFAFRRVDPGAAEGLAALAFRNPSLYVGSGAVTMQRADQFPIRRAAWDRFVARYGPWSAWVDPRTGSILLAEGTGIPFLDDQGSMPPPPADETLSQLEQRARELVNEWSDLFGVADQNLVLARAASGRLADDFWVVSFDVVANRLPIEGETVRLRFRFFSEADEGWGQAAWTIDDVSIVTPSPCAVADLIFADRFESGDTVRWTTSHP